MITSFILLRIKVYGYLNLPDQIWSELINAAISGGPFVANQHSLVTTHPSNQSSDWTCNAAIIVRLQEILSEVGQASENILLSMVYMYYLCHYKQA